mgnify:CR=1 FL=1
MNDVAVQVAPAARPEPSAAGLLAELRLHGVTDLAPVERAFALAERSHAGQVRKSGEPYLTHPLRVAETIARLGLDTSSVIAGLLHDAVEDSDLSVFDLTEQFGGEIAGIVDGVTKLGKVPYLSRQEQQAESFRKMLLAMSQDIRVLLVKLADRLDNMRTLAHMPADKQQRIARETMEIYAPLANRLGIQWLRTELQDLSFRYLEPAIYQGVQAKIDALLAAAPDFVARGLAPLEAAFQPSPPQEGAAPAGDDRVVWDEAIFGPVRVRATVRRPYQVYRLTEEQEHGVDQVSDLVTYTIVVRDRAACYAALGVVHGRFTPVPGRFRDYIALPRQNHYQALHTAVMSHGVRLELQIRSAAMDEVAEKGIIAEWRRDRAVAGNGGWQNLAWLKSLMDWQGEVVDPHEFIAAVKADLFADEVFVFTPQGDIHTFPRGATPIDFAFAIHSDLGVHCSAARINGHMVPLRYQLRQGDTIEIITSPNPAVRKEWLKMCQTSRAQARIKQYLRHQERGRLRALGRSLVEQELAGRGRVLGEFEAQGQLMPRLAGLDLTKEQRTEDGLYEAIGAGQVAAGLVADALAPVAEDADDNLFKRMFRRMSGKKPGPKLPGFGRLAPGQGAPGSPLLVTRERIEAGSSGAPMIQLSPCCSPLPGDPLIGFFLPGKGIVAHVEGCPEALERIAERRLHLAWEPGLEIDGPLTIEVRTTDTVGLLAEMSRAFSHHGINIKQANCRAYDSGQRAINTFQTTVRSLGQLNSLMATLRDIPGVLAVERVFSRASGD